MDHLRRSGNSWIWVVAPSFRGKMVLCRRGLYGLWGVVLLATQVLTQGKDGFFSPAAVPSSLPETTEQMGFFKKIYHAARGLMWHGSANTTKTAVNRLPTPPSPAVARKLTESHILQAIEVNAVANLNFSLRVLSEDFSVEAVPEVYIEGSVIHIEARIQASPSMFPKLFIEECYGANAPHHSHTRKIYIIVNNHGCLHAGDPEVMWFRKTDSVIVFKLPAFLMTDDSEEIYIHCLLTAWSQKLPTNPGKKMCVFDSISSRWKNLDELSKSSICNCCDSYCHQESPHGNLKGERISHRELLGPLRVRKEDAPWLEGKCHTMKRMLLVSAAFVCSCILAALFVGVLIALALAVLRYSGVGRRHRRLRNRKAQRSFHTELQTVVGACTETDEIEKESNMDYCKLNRNTPEKN
ncbi:zona pellucida sperm-binding protein 3-like [Python bivittatus]|uniref:Zona pellucida sperm-binding protein 3-like n=1 Tax=Python bivittatus TaxID=176946 RepID=A0A9F5J9P3_PYTBI|nr:zona pellucida sperm-binding protein 3-like [Python bivittatus]